MVDRRGGPAQGAGDSLPAHGDRAAGPQPAACALGHSASEGGITQKQLFRAWSPTRTGCPIRRASAGRK